MPTRSRTTPRTYNTVTVCLDCGATATGTATGCAHASTARLALTPQVARMLAQLRGARSYVRYLTERFRETVEIEQLAGRAVMHGAAATPVEAASRGSRRRLTVASAHEAAATSDEAAQALVARQAELFGAPVSS